MNAHRSSRGQVRFRLAMLFVVALIAAPLVSVRPSPAVADDAKTPDLSLYLLNRVPRVELRSLDPASLFDRSDRGSLGFDGDSDIWNVVFSKDGTTAVTIGEAVNGVGPTVAVVRDVATWQERRRFEVPETTWMVALSGDGSRLVVRGERWASFGGERWPLWQLFDTRTGTELVSIEGEQADDTGQSFAIDSGAQRLYRLTVPGGWAVPVEHAMPQTARLVVNDLTTGAEVGRLDLPEVRGGYWLSPETTVVQGTEMQVPGQLSPAIALSPDGRHLAIVHADEGAVTLVDAEQLTVERTMEFAARRGWLDRFLGVVPLWPQEASAKLLDGALVDAVFSADGRHLYVFGMSGGVEDGQPVFRSLGLRVVDVGTGEVVGSALEDVSLETVQPAPDGSGVYVSSYGDGATTWRLDPLSLDVLAVREFGDWPQLVLGPTT